MGQKSDEEVVEKVLQVLKLKRSDLFDDNQSKEKVSSRQLFNLIMLGLCGWNCEKNQISIASLICDICQRRVLLENFNCEEGFATNKATNDYDQEDKKNDVNQLSNEPPRKKSKIDHENAKKKMRGFGEHRYFCPWVDLTQTEKVYNILLQNTEDVISSNSFNDK